LRPKAGSALIRSLPACNRFILRGSRKVYSSARRLFEQAAAANKPRGQVRRTDATTERSFREEKEMTRFSYCALAVLAALTMTSGAYARVNHTPSIQPGAHASVVGTSETDIRKQCAEEARARWGTTNQDMQKNRDMAASTCMVEHGVRNP
jgi:hypothetical protein